MLTSTRLPAGTMTGDSETIRPEGAAPRDARAPGGLHEQDLHLSRSALAGSLSARRAFAERMQCVPKFLSVLNTRAGRPLSIEELEDLVQETLVTIWRRLDAYAGLASLDTWAYRFCQFSLAGSLRRKQRQPLRVELNESHDQEAQAAPADHEGLLRALERLPEADAHVVRLRHYDRLSFDEIADRTGLPFGSVRARYYRVLARLRELLEPIRKEGAL